APSPCGRAPGRRAAPTPWAARHPFLTARPGHRWAASSNPTPTAATGSALWPWQDWSPEEDDPTG
ncbi:hypothetical protein ACNPQN_32600, partial [Streptomyces sp. NPDC056297]|uniref:hypothetical protein n=1 Tax=Streptomyces sp. NPDC056297 TaxID=3345776 RepID=UPI003AAF2813